LILLENAQGSRLSCKQAPPIDPNTLPKDVDALQKIVVDLCERLRHESAENDKYRSLLRELLEAQRSRKSEQLSKEQLKLFEELWKAWQPEEASEEPAAAETGEDEKPPEAPVKSEPGGSLWPRIWSGNGSCTTWRKQKSTVTIAAKISISSPKRAANATNTFRPS
jgi:hypothetical protein